MRIHVSGPAWSALLLLTLAACDAGTPAEPSPASDPELVKEATPAKATDQIEIRLDVQPNDAQDIGFRMTGAKSASFALDDDALVRNRSLDTPRATRSDTRSSGRAHDSSARPSGHR